MFKSCNISNAADSAKSYRRANLPVCMTSALSSAVVCGFTRFIYQTFDLTDNAPYVGSAASPWQAGDRLNLDRNHARGLVFRDWVFTLRRSVASPRSTAYICPLLSPRFQRFLLLPEVPRRFRQFYCRVGGMPSFFFFFYFLLCPKLA